MTYKHGSFDTLMASYGVEREAVAARLVRATGSFTKLVANRNPAVRAVRDRLAAFVTSIPAVSDRFRDAISELDIIYEKSPAVLTQGRTPNPRPGAHAPNAVFIRTADNGRTTLFSMASSLRYLLLVFTYRRDQFIHEMLLDLQRHADIVEPCIVARDATVGGAHVLDPTGTAFRAYNAEGEPQYVLVRPDGYVAARGAVRDYRLLIAHLDGIFSGEASSAAKGNT